MTKVSIDYVVGCSFTVLGILIFAVLTVVANRWRRRADDWDRGFSIAASIGAPVALLLVVGLFIGTAWPPFNMDYHSYRQVHGTVADVQARFLGDGNSTSQMYAVRLADSGQIYRCDDTRCSLLKPGDQVWLWCIREWVQASTPGYDCNFDRTEAKS